MSEVEPHSCTVTRHFMTKKVWSSRFTKKLHPLAERFTESISFDSRLAPYDIEGSIAHVKMLAHAKIIKPGDSKKIINGLERIKKGKSKFSTAHEDIHMNIENALNKLIGPVAGHLHTGRSRNDQVQLDMRLYTRDKIKDIAKLLTDTQKALLNLSEKNLDVIIPGFTHLQHAQPVLLAHHLLAYINMLQRDKERLQDLLKRVNVLPLGSGALAGSGLPLDRKYLAKQLGFPRVSDNSMDSVSDRDYLIELLSDLAIIGMHLSRLAEEFVLWSTKEFGFIDIDESLCTGSSLMPQKKNPDVAELLRAKTGRLNGNLVSLLTILKGLPLTYNRDLQEDKPPVFDSVDTIETSLGVTCLLVKGIKVNKGNLKKVFESDTSWFATDMAESLVASGIPFRKAYQDIGKLVKRGINLGTKVTPKISVSAKKTIGSTNPKMVYQSIKKWKKFLT